VAEEQYTKALAFGESHRILKDRGVSRYRQEKFEDALIDFNRAIQMYPEDGKYYYWRSKTHSQLEQHREALSDIILANQLEPHDEYIGKHLNWLASKFESLGYDLNKNGKPKEAVEQYDAALRLTPDSANLYNRRARAFINLHRYDAAINDLKKAIALDPREFAYYQLMDWVLAKRKDWNQIIAYWDQYIRLNPTHSSAYVERGGAYFHKGDIKSAVRNAKIAADMGNLDGKQIHEKYKHVLE
jgi:tetratricopeptide (TPR) repeat protein